MEHCGGGHHHVAPPRRAVEGAERPVEALSGQAGRHLGDAPVGRRSIERRPACTAASPHCTPFDRVEQPLRAGRERRPVGVVAGANPCSVRHGNASRHSS